MQAATASARSRAIALGYFDGVHIGHQALLLKLTEQIGHIRTVYTFYNHPSSFLSPEREPLYICTPEERAALLKEHGADEVLMPVFDRDVATLQPEKFAERLLNDLCAKVIITGENYRFGQNAQGDAELLYKFAAKRGVEVHAIRDVFYKGEAVSSTRIRAMLKTGRIGDVNAMLGRTYTLTGTIEKGRQIGTSLRIPTANICHSPARAIPADGVYGGTAFVGCTFYPAVINIGCNPTVNGDKRTIEAHIIGFTGDLYGKSVSVGFKTFLREEIKFSSAEELKIQIQRDIEAVAKRQYLA